MRRNALFLGAVLFGLAASHPLAQDYPTRPIRFVVPAAPGGSADILTRLIGNGLNERFKQPVIVENRGGAGQMIGADHVAKSAPDGHTILLVTVTYTTSAATRPKLPFDALNDLTGVAMVGEGPLLLNVHPSVPVKSVKELIAFARARPGKLDYGSAGTGSIIHLVTEVFAGMAKLDLVHVPYTGIAGAVTAAVAGEIPLLIASMPASWPQVKAGRLRALAVTTAQRSHFVPDLPTISEAGVPGYDTGTWWGVLAPGKTPRPIVGRLNGAINQMLSSDEMKARLATEGAQPVQKTPEEFTAIIKSDIARWLKVVRERNITPN
jgi:tripartite-type tricarboxylate transporter receptor subunit TctC